MVYKELELLPAYTPCYVAEQFKVYLERKNKSKYVFFMIQDVLALINYAKIMKNITEEQAIELKNILKNIK